MKKIFKMMAVMVSAAAVAVSCDSTGKGGSAEPETPVNPLVGTYSIDNYKAEGEKNAPVTSPFYAVWSGNDATVNLQNLFQVMGGAMIPQLLGSVELKEDGNICATYVQNPVVKGQDKLMQWGMQAMFGGAFPTEEEVKALTAEVGEMVTSADGLATWSEADGMFNVKLDIAAIVGASAGDQGGAIVEIIETVLKSEPAELKAMLSAILGEKIMSLTDDTIKQLQGWALNGIPMKAEFKDEKVNLYLPKTAFDSLFTMRETGETDESGQKVESNDLMILFEALMEKQLIPQEYQAIALLLPSFGGEWGNTTDFRLGLTLVKTK